jgi:hypothetical protein
MIGADRKGADMSAGLTYEEQLSQYGVDWALCEASRFFEGKSATHRTMRRVAQRLSEFGIPYAVVGGMALFLHGFRQFTENVDFLITAEGLAKAHEVLEALNRAPLAAGSRVLRDAETGVRVQFLITGRYPGDGKPKPVAFPDPAEVSEDWDGVRRVRLNTLLEMKLAFGITHRGRLKDLADAQDLIQVLRLPADFADQLHPFVRDEYLSLRRALAEAPPDPERDLT